MPIHPRLQQQPRFEPLSRQRPQQRLLDGEVFTDSADAVPDPAIIIVTVGASQLLVELGQRRHFRDGDQVVAAEASALTLDTAFFVGSGDSRDTVKRLEALMGSKQDPALVFDPAAITEEHPRHGGFQIVVTDVAGGDAAEFVERLEVTF